MDEMMTNEIIGEEYRAGFYDALEAKDWIACRAILKEIEDQKLGNTWNMRRDMNLAMGEEKVPCDCPKGGMDSEGRTCEKCEGTEWVPVHFAEKDNPLNGVEVAGQ